ncbi:uncharacterized protein LOC122023145 [Zingiber officinale]|uniref:uncharacterized protein LOC122023145 n=1 Tax=Zingiber officinale TaxID=94328 RepID=UPI001C4BC49B|nr:uncharacterized protein LOC122023145 [Zingiber officinale]
MARRRNTRADETGNPVTPPGNQNTMPAIPTAVPDYDIILGMDFLSKYGASIECRNRKVVFRLESEPMFEFIGEPRKGTKEFLSAIKAQKMLNSGCTGFLACVVDTSQAENQKLEDVKIVCNYPENDTNRWIKQGVEKTLGFTRTHTYLPKASRTPLTTSHLSPSPSNSSHALSVQLLSDKPLSGEPFSVNLPSELLSIKIVGKISSPYSFTSSSNSKCPNRPIFILKPRQCRCVDPGIVLPLPRQVNFGTIVNAWHGSISRTRYQPFTNSITEQARQRPLQITSPRSPSSFIGFRLSSLSSLSSAALLREKLRGTGGKPPASKDLADSDPATLPSRSLRASTPLASPSSSPVPFSSFPPTLSTFTVEAVGSE